MGRWDWERGQSALMVSVLMHETHTNTGEAIIPRASVAAAKYTSKRTQTNTYEDNPYLLYYLKKNHCFDKLGSPLHQLHSSNIQSVQRGGR